MLSSLESEDFNRRTDALKAVELWLEGSVSGTDERHVRRIDKIKAIEDKNYV
jgi:ribose 5-phosphate isomerase RpiB